MAASVAHFASFRCSSATWHTQRMATARNMKSRQLSSVVGASAKRPFLVRPTARRSSWASATCAFVFPLRQCKAFLLPHEAFRRMTSSSVIGTARGLQVREAGYSPPSSAKQENVVGFLAVHEDQGSMPEDAKTRQASSREIPLHSHGTPSAQSHPENRPLVTVQKPVMGNERSFEGTHVGRGTFQAQLQGSLQGVAKVLGALFLANALALCSPPPALVSSPPDTINLAGPDAFPKVQGTLMRIAKVVGALLLAAALALCTPRAVLAAQQRKAPASRSASTASRGSNKHSGRAQSTPGGGPVKAAEERTSASDERVVVEAVVEEASATDQGGAAVAALEERDSTTSVEVPVKTVVDERFTVMGEGAPLNASGLGGAVLGSGGEKAPATRVTNGARRVGLAGGLGTRLKKAVDAFKEPLEVTGGANTAEHNTRQGGGAAFDCHTCGYPSSSCTR
jgi:hypothetical protein